MKMVVFPEVLARVAKLPGTQISAEGRTLRELINNICEQHADLRGHLFYHNDNFKEHFLLTANGALIDPDSELSEGCEVDILLATSGGLDLDELSNAEIKRYVRHITLPNVGREGQLRLKKSRVLIIGTGGLGSPVALYLAAAGVGTLGLIDFDIVESSNLQRQIVHGTSTLGLPKVESAKQRLLDINTDIRINTYNSALSVDNALALIGEYDIVVDGSDNFATRYLVNDACVLLNKPFVYGAIYRFDGQMSVFNYQGGPCYRCLFPQSPPPELAPNCSAGGVIGVLPGVVGLIQATETVKLILNLGKSLSGRLMRFDALEMRFINVNFNKREDCAVCSANPSITALTHHEFACSTAPAQEPLLTADCYVAPKALQQILESRSAWDIVLDVRDANELEVCALQGSLNIPLAELGARIDELDKDKTYYVVCYGGVRAERAVNILRESSIAKAFVLAGGMKGWVRDIDPEMPIY